MRSFERWEKAAFSMDGLKGFPDAITSVFPDCVVQTCVVHLIRHSLQFASWRDRKPLAKVLYRILCVSRLWSSLGRQHETIPELDGELELGSMPFFRGFPPLGGDVPQRQVNQLGGRLVTREMALVPDCLADLAVQTLNSIGGVQDFAHLRGEGEERDHFLPA